MSGAGEDGQGSPHDDLVPNSMPATALLHAANTPTLLYLRTPSVCPNMAWTTVGALVLFMSALALSDQETDRRGAATYFVTSLCICAAQVATAVLACTTFKITADTWHVSQRHRVLWGFGLTWQSISGSTAGIVGARVVDSSNATARTYTNNRAHKYNRVLQFLEQPSNAREAIPITVYDPHRTYDQVPLSALDQEYVAREVCGLLRRLGHTVCEDEQSNTTAVGYPLVHGQQSKERWSPGSHAGDGDALATRAAPAFAGKFAFAQPQAQVPPEQPLDCPLRVDRRPDGSTVVRLPRRGTAANVAAAAIDALICLWVGDVLFASFGDSGSVTPLAYLVTAVTILLCFAWRMSRYVKYLRTADELRWGADGWALQQAQLRNCAGLRWVLPSVHVQQQAGTWEGFAGAKVVSYAVSRERYPGRTFGKQPATWHGAACGVIAFVYSDGSEELLLLDVNIPVQSLQVVVSQVNSSIDSTPPENDLACSALIDLAAPPLFAQHVRGALHALPTPCAWGGRVRAALGVATGAALEDEQAEVLRELSGAVPQALRVPPLRSRRVHADGSAGHTLTVTLSHDPQPLTAALRVAMRMLLVLLVISPLTLFILIMASDSGKGIVVIMWLAFTFVYCPWFAAVPLSIWTGLRTAAYDVTLAVGRDAWQLDWRVQGWPQRVLGKRCSLRSFGGSTHQLVRCEIISKPLTFGGALTVLLLRTASGTHVLSNAPFQSLTLREKVYAMQQINAYLAACQDSGEGGVGGSFGDVTQALLPGRVP